MGIRFLKILQMLTFFFSSATTGSTGHNGTILFVIFDIFRKCGWWFYEGDSLTFLFLLHFVYHEAVFTLQEEYKLFLSQTLFILLSCFFWRLYLFLQMYKINSHDTYRLRKDKCVHLWVGGGSQIITFILRLLVTYVIWLHTFMKIH